MKKALEAILFLPAMAALAAVIGAGILAIGWFGGFCLTWIYYALTRIVGLPEPAALACAVILAAFAVYAVVPRVPDAILWLRARPRR